MSLFLKTAVKIACLRLDGKMDVVIELLKPERRKSEKISVLSLIIFVGMSVSWLTFVESKLKIYFKFLPYLHAKRKKENTVSCCILLLFEYAWVITIFYRSFNNWIIDVIWDRVAVNIFCNFEVTIGKEGIQNLCCINLTFNDFILFIKLLSVLTQFYWKRTV